MDSRFRGNDGKNLIIETKGGEMDKRFDIYAWIGVWQYIVFDPMKLVQKSDLRVYDLYAGHYTPKFDSQLPNVGLQAILWEGRFEGILDKWLRWRDPEANLILLGEESAEREREMANRESEQANRENEGAERLAAELKSMGIDP